MANNELLLRLFDDFINLILPRSFIGLKIRLFGLVIFGLVFDIGVQLIANYDGVILNIDGPNPIVIISCLLTLIVLVLVDWILYIRQQNIVFRLLFLIPMLNLPSTVVNQLLNSILEQARRTY